MRSVLNDIARLTTTSLAVLPMCLALNFGMGGRPSRWLAGRVRSNPASILPRIFSVRVREKLLLRTGSLGSAHVLASFYIPSRIGRQSEPRLKCVLLILRQSPDGPVDSCSE